MIRDTTAQRIASEWHGGGGSALYALSSTGAITDATEYELLHIDTEAYPLSIAREVDKLYAYAQHHGPRDPQPDWYTRVVCKGR